MFCTKCGNRLPETATFCTKCGARMQQPATAPVLRPVQPVPQPVAPAAVRPPRKKGKGWALVLGIGLPVTALAVAFFVWALPALTVQHTGVTVGAQGGTVKLEDMQLDFVGAATPVDVQVTKSSPSGAARPEGLQSALYTLDADAALTQPMTLRFAVAKDTGDLLIGIGTEMTDQNGKTAVHYRFVPTTVKDGFAQASINPSEYAAQALLPMPHQAGLALAASPGDLRLTVGMFRYNSAYFKENGHFYLYYGGTVNKPAAEALLRDLEDIYQYYQDKGYAYAARTKWPMEVYVTSLDGELGAYVESGLKNMVTGRSPDHGWIEVKREYFLGGYQQEAVKPVLTHEFFHFVQANYESAGGETTEWFDEATATYYESIARSATPDIVGEHQMEIFDGVLPAQDSRGAGYARMPEIGFLVARFGETALRDVYVNVSKGSKVKDALASATGMDAASWAGDCYEHIVSGKSGSMVPYTAWRNISGKDSEFGKIGGTMELKYPSQEDIEQAQADGEPILLDTGTIDVPPLGARMLAVTVDEELTRNLSDGAKLMFKAQSGVDMRLFRIKGSTFTVTKANGTEIDVDTLKDDLTKGMNYLLLVTNLSELSAATVPVSAELQDAPTLDELVGSFDDGQITFTEVYISQKLRDQAKAAAQEAANSEDPTAAAQGCDEKMIEEIDKVKGQTKPYKFTIQKTGDSTGIFTLIGEENYTMDMPFTYSNGVLTVEYDVVDESGNADQAGKIQGPLNAAYGKNKDVIIDGTLRYTTVAYPDDFYIDYHIVGSHFLPPTP